MWTREQLKTKAKAILKLSYWKAFLVSLIIAFAGGSSGGGDGLIILALAFAFRIFLGYPLEVGGRRYFVKSTVKDFDLNNLGYAFNKSRYMGIELYPVLRKNALEKGICTAEELMLEPEGA